MYNQEAGLEIEASGGAKISVMDHPPFQEGPGGCYNLPGPSPFKEPR